MNAVATMLTQVSLDTMPPEVAARCYRLIHTMTGNDDPYRAAKTESNDVALEWYPKLKYLVASAQKPLMAACKLAIAGNSLDFGPGVYFGDIPHLINTAIERPLTINHFPQLLSSVTEADQVLYLGDNAGEVVFDRVLIEELKRARDLNVTFVVREKPIINDATMTDALAIGMSEVATVVSSGCDTPATIYARCSPRLRELFRCADVIISKGQGNYESLSEAPWPIFFMLRAKCEVTARQLGVVVGDVILMQGGGGKNTSSDT
jgi:uncharacterized protein with ATP-grasp and redox domains